MTDELTPKQIEADHAQLLVRHLALWMKGAEVPAEIEEILDRHLVDNRCPTCWKTIATIRTPLENLRSDPFHSHLTLNDLIAYALGLLSDVHPQLDRRMDAHLKTGCPTCSSMIGGIITTTTE